MPEDVYLDFIDLTDEKFCDLFNIIDSTWDDVYLLIEKTNELLIEKLIKADDVIDLLFDLKNRFENTKLNITSKMPVVHIGFGLLFEEDEECVISIIDPNVEQPPIYASVTALGFSGGDVEIRVGWPLETYLIYGDITPIVRGMSVRYRLRGQLIYVLLLLYKYTNLGQNAEFLDILKKYGIYDLIDHLSKIDYKVRYPVTELVEKLLGGRSKEFMDALRYELPLYIDAELKYEVIACLRDIMMGKVKPVTKYYTIYRAWNGENYRYVYLGFSATSSPPTSKEDEVRVYGYFTPRELIGIVDEVIFALAYHATVLTNMYKYLSGEA